MRRVVTGIDSNGKAIFVSDGEPEFLAAARVPPGITQLWGWDSRPAVPTDGTKPTYMRTSPRAAACA
jgi:hypothetical protein